MAAVSEDSRIEAVFGNKRVVLAQIDAAATLDTWVTGLSVIDTFFLTPPSTTAVGGSKSGGTITLAYGGGGAMANIQAVAIGT